MHGDDATLTLIARMLAGFRSASNVKCVLRQQPHFGNPTGINWLSIASTLFTILILQWSCDCCCFLNALKYYLLTCCYVYPGQTDPRELKRTCIRLLVWYYTIQLLCWWMHTTVLG